MLAALYAISAAVASPLAAHDISPRDHGLTERSSPLSLSPRVTLSTPLDVAKRDTTTDIEVRNEGATTMHLDRRQVLQSKFKLHVVTASGKVIGIIIVNYIIDSLQAGLHESISATYDKLTNVPIVNEIVAAHFSNPDAPFLSAQNGIFHFATKMVEGTVNLAMDKSGLVTNLASATGVKLVGNYVAKYLRIFDSNNVKIAELGL